MEILDKAESVRVAWNQWIPPEYTLDRSFLEWNLSRQSWLSYFVEEIHRVPCLFAVASHDGKSLGMNENGLWLSLYGEIEDPAGFLQALKEYAKSINKTRIQFGGEEFHFVSGIPRSEKCQGLLSELEKWNFRTSDVVDYAGKISSNSIQEFVQKYRPLANEQGFYFLKVEAEKDAEKMHEYLAKEFPGRWHREFLYYRKLCAENNALLSWFFFYDKQKNILGFSRIGKAVSKFSSEQWYPGALRLPVADQMVMPDACLGPIGISNSYRGKGLGNLLLALTLENLLRVNAELLCIDWTDAYNYYKPLALKEVRRIRNASLNLR
ncbi:MAG: hypothetical protein M9962_12945 [Oligoflexia bacterium]|nr:hypothetical protein [Oligoflexia bacterium]